MNILEEANKITHGDRNESYGPPHENMQHIARISTAILGKEITAQDIVMIMLATKISRQTFHPKKDNWVDLAGYAWVGNEVQENE